MKKYIGLHWRKCCVPISNQHYKELIWASSHPANPQMTKTHVVHVMYGCEVYIQTYCNSSHVQIRVSCNQSIALWRHACDLLNTSHLHHFIFYTAHAKQCLLSLFIYWEFKLFPCWWFSDNTLLHIQCKTFHTVGLYISVYFILSPKNIKWCLPLFPWYILYYIFKQSV